MPDTPVLWSMDERGVAHVILNRPAVNNAYDGGMIDGLHAAMDALSGEAGLRVVVMLYDREGRIIGTGAGYGSAGSLAPGATTIFDVQCAMLADAPIAYYDYMVQSDS